MGQEDFQLNIEQIREQLAMKVKADLEKYGDEVEDFNLTTSSRKGHGGFRCISKLFPIAYESRLKEQFEISSNYDFSRSTDDQEVNYYLFDTKKNIVRLCGYLGRLLHTPLRDGNNLDIIIKFKNDAKNQRILIESIMNLLKTMKNYSVTKNNNTEEAKQEDLKNITKQGLPVLKAFSEFGKKYEKGGDITIEELIEQYESISKNSSDGKVF